MSEFPKSLQDPDSEQRLVEKLSLDEEEIAMLDYIRRDLRALHILEQKFKEQK